MPNALGRVAQRSREGCTGEEGDTPMQPYRVGEVTTWLMAQWATSRQREQ